MKYYRENRLRVLMVISNVILSVIPVIVIGIIAYSVHYNSMKKNVSGTVDILFGTGRVEQQLQNRSAPILTV